MECTVHNILDPKKQGPPVPRIDKPKALVPKRSYATVTSTCCKVSLSAASRPYIEPSVEIVALAWIGFLALCVLHQWVHPVHSPALWVAKNVAQKRVPYLRRYAWIWQNREREVGIPSVGQF